MNLPQLKAFVTLADCASVTETAERLFCTQPAVSIKIRKLEESLDTVLFERMGNRLHLTAQGKIFYQYASEILRLLKVVQEHIHQYDDPGHGKISLGASHFVGIYLLPGLMAAYRHMAPQVELSLNILPSRQLIDSLENRDVDFLIMSDQVAFDRAHYHCHTFFADESVLVVAPGNPLARQPQCALQDILTQTFLIKPSHSQTRKFLLHHLGEALFAQLTTMEINSLEGIKQCVMHNLGISIVSRLAVADELRRGELVEVALEKLKFQRGICYIHHKARYLSPATERFLAYLRASGDIPAQRDS